MFKNLEESADKLIEIASKFSKIIGTRSMHKKQIVKRVDYILNSLPNNIKILKTYLGITKKFCPRLHKKLQQNTKTNERKPK